MGHLPEPWTSSATLYMDSPACSACRPTPAAGAAGGRWRFCRLCPPTQRWASPPQGPRARVRAASCPVAPPGGRQRQRPSSGPEPSARGVFVLLSRAPRAPPEAAGERGQALPGTAWARGRPHECRGCKQGVPWSSADRHCTSQQRAACRRRRRRCSGVLPLACGQAGLLDTRGPGVAGRGRVWPGDEKTQAKELVGILGCHLDLPPPRAQHPTAAGRRWPWASAPWIGKDYRPGRSRSRVLWRSGRGERGASWHLAILATGQGQKHLAAAASCRRRHLALQACAWHTTLQACSLWYWGPGGGGAVCFGAAGAEYEGRPVGIVADGEVAEQVQAGRRPGRAQRAVLRS